MDYEQDWALGFQKITLGIKDYLVFKDGRVFDIKRNKWQKVRQNNDGYLSFVSHILNKALYFSVHQVVAMAFLNHKVDGSKIIIDHINGDKKDNRVENLKIVTQRQNQQNQKRHREGRLVGAHFNKTSKKWTSNIKINKKLKYLGSFQTQLQAHNRYLLETTKGEI